MKPGPVAVVVLLGVWLLVASLVVPQMGTPVSAVSDDPETGVTPPWETVVSWWGYPWWMKLLTTVVPSAALLLAVYIIERRRPDEEVPDA